MNEVSITVKLSLELLSTYTDEHLAALWHVAQANPAEHGDPIAGEIVTKLTFEIVRRWLAGIPAEIYTHQPRDQYWEQLRRFAKYVPPEGVDLYGDEIAWHRGTWVLKDEQEVQS